MTTIARRPSGNSLVYVYDGRGHVLSRGPKGFEAFDRDDKSVGAFPTAKQAAGALLVKESGLDEPVT